MAVGFSFLYNKPTINLTVLRVMDFWTNFFAGWVPFLLVWRIRKLLWLKNFSFYFFNRISQLILLKDVKLPRK
ncbi:MAG: hypothetical protein Ct9H300mP18_06880 [Candidatus Neomarinimicrobiota bacterium]|nr:MAG: hypothetical protein Ct9H300mP18_06880 [Candidatus Neomarinimicrobiota bacterium]